MHSGVGPTSGGRKHFRSYENESPESLGPKEAKQPRFTPEPSGPQTYRQKVALHERRVAQHTLLKTSEKVSPTIDSITEQRIHERFLNIPSADDLFKKVGRKVKNREWFLVNGDRTIESLFPNEVKGQIKKIQELEKELLSPSECKNQQFGSHLIQKLDDLREDILKARRELEQQQQGSSYWSQLLAWYNGDCTAVSDIADMLIHWINSEMQLINQVAFDPGTQDCCDILNWNQAIEFKRLGYNLDPHFTFCRYTDESRASKAASVAGVGRISKAIKIPYQENGIRTEKIFKAAEPVDRTGWEYIVGKGQYFDARTPHFTARNRAVHIIDQKLGLNLTPEVDFGEHNNQLGMVMDVAPGKTCRHRFLKNDHQTGSLNRVLNGKAQPKKHAAIMKQLNQLEWLDALCALPDRHMENAMVCKKTGKITAIDNDIALFPMGEVIEPDQSRNGPSVYRAGCRIGYPALVSRETIDALEALDIEGLHNELEHLLSPEELTALKTRYRRLYCHAIGLEQLGLAVDNWQTWRSQEGLTAAQYLDHCEANRDDLGEVYQQQARALLDKKASLHREHQTLSADDYHTLAAYKNLTKTMYLSTSVSYFTDVKKQNIASEDEEFSDEEDS